jgi:hypothetical protein
MYNRIFTRWRLYKSLTIRPSHCPPPIICNVSPSFGSRSTINDTRRPESCHRVYLTCTADDELSDNILLKRVSQNALAALANIIQSSVKQIEAAVTANSFTIHSADSLFTVESEAQRMHPDILSAGSLITSTAVQLMTLVRPAPLTVVDIMMQVRLNVLTTWEICKFQVSTAVRTAINMHVAEILRDAGS